MAGATEQVLTIVDYRCLSMQDLPGQYFSSHGAKPLHNHVTIRLMTDALNDVALIDRFKAGDQSAFDVLVSKCQDRIYNLCRHMLGNAHDAQDAAQDVFIKAYRNLGRFKPDASLYTWLRVIPSAAHISQ